MTLYRGLWEVKKVCAINLVISKTECIALGSSEWPNMLTFALPISLASSKLDRDLRT